MRRYLPLIARPLSLPELATACVGNCVVTGSDSNDKTQHSCAAAGHQPGQHVQRPTANEAATGVFNRRA